MITLFLIKLASEFSSWLYKKDMLFQSLVILFLVFLLFFLLLLVVIL